MSNRYTTCRVKINGPTNGRTEVLDTTIDGGEGEPLIVASFFDRAEAEKFVACVNALAGIADPAAFVEAFEKMRWTLEAITKIPLDGTAAAKSRNAAMEALAIAAAVKP